MRDQRETLSARRATTLVKSFRQNQSADERKWYMFLCKTAAAFTQEQAEHLEQTFALLGTVSNASTAGVPPPSSDEAEVLSRSVVDCIALQIWDIEKAFRERQGGATSPAVLPDSHVLVGGRTEVIRNNYLLPNDLGLPRALIAGGGGCGKTTMLENLQRATACALTEQNATTLGYQQDATRHRSRTYARRDTTRTHSSAIS